MTLPFDAVLCDFDGVLKFQDFDHQAQIEHAYGLQAGTVAAIASEPALIVPAMTGLITREEWMASTIPALTGLVGSAERARKLTAEWVAARTWIDEKAMALLRRVRARVPVVLVSNATSELADHLRELGIADAFTHIVSSYDVGVAKPDRRIYEIAAERAAVPADRCFYIDDRSENVEAAMALGMTGVPYGGYADLRSALAPILNPAA